MYTSGTIVWTYCRLSYSITLAVKETHLLRFQERICIEKQGRSMRENAPNAIKIARSMAFIFVGTVIVLSSVDNYR